MKLIWRAFCLSLCLLVAKSALAQEESLFVVGSTSFSKLIEETATVFKATTGISLLSRPTGSSKGVVAIGESVSDIGVISRYMTEEEIARWPNLRQITVGQDAIVFFVNENLNLDNISSDQISDIYTGKLQYWADLNIDTNGRIIPLSKGLGHGTLSSFQQYFGLINNRLPESGFLLFRNARKNQLFGTTRIKTFNQINQAFGLVSRRSGAIAFDSMGAYSISVQGMQNRTKLLSLDGIAPMIDGEFNPQYTFVRPLNVLVSDNSGEAAEAFIRFLLSEQGQSLIKQQKYISLPENFAITY